MTHSGIGTDANAAIARTGMAWAFTKYLTDPRIKPIEMEARAERLTCPLPAVPP